MRLRTKAQRRNFMQAMIARTSSLAAHWTVVPFGKGRLLALHSEYQEFLINFVSPILRIRVVHAVQYLVQLPVLALFLFIKTLLSFSNQFFDEFQVHLF
jgi:hypothetical protein